MRLNLKTKLIISSIMTACFFIIGGMALMVTNKLCVSKADSTKVNPSESNTIKDNVTMFQAFEWETNNDGQHWNRIAGMAEELDNLGINQIWLPPAYKGEKGISDVGYSPYDLYDLGEFYGNTHEPEKLDVRTRYGKKDEYINAIKKLQEQGIKVYADAVLNHKAGGEQYEELPAIEVYKDNTNYVKNYNYGNVRLFSIFNFDVFGEKSRNNKYSSFKWDASCFDGVDWDCAIPNEENYARTNSVYLLKGKNWDWEVDSENGNYDFLTCNDIDFDNEKVVEELTKWGEWYVNTTGVDGFRLDAVKHIKYDFFTKWIKDIENKTGKELNAVSEYLSHDISKIENYVSKTNGEFDVFDFPLYYQFRDASKGGYDLRKLFDTSLTNRNPDVGVMFVDNHDKQVGRVQDEYALQQWFKGAAYTAILTRQGKSCVYYGDYFGTNEVVLFSTSKSRCEKLKNKIDPLLYARKHYAYGEQVNYFENPDYIGWVRKGDKEHKGSGLAALISDNDLGGSIWMDVGKEHAGEIWYDITGNEKHKVIINADGYGEFSVRGNEYGNCFSVWVADNSNKYCNATQCKNEDKVTVYYKGDLEEDVHIVYGTDENDWIDGPGIKMEESEYAEYKKVVLEIDNKTELKFCFHDGKNNWQNNDWANYVAYGPGIYTVLNGKLIRDNPQID